MLVPPDDSSRRAVLCPLEKQKEETLRLLSRLANRVAIGESRSAQAAHSGQQSLELLTAISAALQVILHQRHGLGSILAGQVKLHEAVDLPETLFAPYLVWVSRQDVPHHPLE
jgi:hypothetical protein